MLQNNHRGPRCMQVAWCTQNRSNLLKTYKFCNVSIVSFTHASHMVHATRAILLKPWSTVAQPTFMKSQGTHKLRDDAFMHTQKQDGIIMPTLVQSTRRHLAQP
mmetsp:Transcript_12231/g.33373  ORF Transcript_12231/g.33373 Transcript_12231/m.33373 type:complete len:104 (-) Transcript_12231:885-1196(-)